MTELLRRIRLEREPAAICGGVTFFTLALHSGGHVHLWTVPIVIAGAWLSYVIDELWQARLDAAAVEAPNLEIIHND